ncbi:hypothetical protein [Streptacidiphilus sp. PAMC 29251]
MDVGLPGAAGQCRAAREVAFGVGQPSQHPFGDAQLKGCVQVGHQGRVVDRVDEFGGARGRRQCCVLVAGEQMAEGLLAQGVGLAEPVAVPVRQDGRRLGVVARRPVVLHVVGVVGQFQVQCRGGGGALVGQRGESGPGDGAGLGVAAQKAFDPDGVGERRRLVRRFAGQGRPQRSEQGAALRGVPGQQTAADQQHLRLVPVRPAFLEQRQRDL